MAVPLHASAGLFCSLDSHPSAQQQATGTALSDTFTMVVGLSMAEICSSFPTSGNMKEPFDEEEEQLILMLHVEMGNKWAKIAT
ncbi:hypothetical protein GUJ93_ZPchr0458g22324 [Zizania palustris]|uniref:HTH myb-type domain-containing protein n=1 Tax=Zizania palustris TaxID=103762 RepID=A0A8J5V012_ZIZPA|nr:hypothetical protein GUJ93_ZPchr0458g22324 [Zizania palustris]